ncbi:glycosyltransferase [Methylovorus mays]|uniref:glycosyltransferase n=1 Tax=Methylovorus mays TaxID=184077 RepID=UPI001E4EF70D|nr:glycosyltransferase [Methylovorus mays]MCB5206961.1 glycosyltransferase [Methylovorus mays]
MNICMVMASRGNGGLEKHVRELASELVRQGHDVTIAAPAAFLASLPANIGRMPIPAHLGRYHPWLLLKLLLALRRGGYDLVHAQASKAASLVNQLRPWLALPTLATLHNIKRDVRLYARFDHIIAVSRQLAASLPREKTSVVYNGIDAPEAPMLDIRQHFALPADYPVLVAVGRLVHAKGFDLLLEAVDGLPLALLIVGDGPEHARLTKRVQGMNPTTRCMLTRHRDDAPSLMRSADAVMICSRREGFSYVCNEALLLGARVLSTDVPVANEVLPPDFIVPTGDVASLRSRLCHWLNRPAEWAVLQQPAREFAAQQFTLPVMVTNTLTVYRRLIDHA